MTAGRKKTMLVVLATLLVAALVIGMTYAYFTDEEEVTNVFTMGDLDIDLEEEWDPEDGEEMRPGDTVIKEPVISAVKGDSYMRVIMTIIDKNEGVAADTKVTATERLTKILQTLYYDGSASGTIAAGTKYSLAQIGLWPATVTSYFNTVDFEQHSASGGVYVLYYKANSYVFEEGEEATLFTHVVIPTDWSQEDLALLGSYDIEIRAEAIQIEGFTSHTLAFSALDAQIAAAP